MPFLFYWYEHSVYSFLVIAQPQISVLIHLSPPFCPLLLDDFISSWVSTTIYKPGMPRSIFPSRTLLRVYQNSQRGTSDSTYLPLPFPKLAPFVFLFQWTGAHCSFIHSLKNPNPKCSCPPPFLCQISHQVSLVIPLVTPKAVPFSVSLFYLRSFYSLLKLWQKPT